MTLVIRLDHSQIAELQSIRDLGEKSLRAVVEHFQKLPVAPVRLEKLFEEAAKILPKQPEEAVSLFRQGLTMQGWIRQEGCTVADVLEAVRQSLLSDSNWGE